MLKISIHTKTGFCERGQVLQSIADVLNKMQQSQFKSTFRPIKDHLKSLLNALLKKVLSAKSEYEIKFSKLEIQKIEDNENSAEAVQNRSMKRLLETKNREGC